MLADTEFKSAAQLTCQECVEGAMLADRLGFSTVWKGEGNNRAPGVLLSARTSRIAVSGGVNHLFARTPASFAVEAVTLNELAEGRYIAGLGVGNETVVRWHGSAHRTTSKIMREYVSVVRRIYAGERWEGGGWRFTGAGFRLAFAPPKAPLPVWFTVRGPRMSRLAGEIADGVLVKVGDAPVESLVAEDGAASAGATGRPAGPCRWPRSSGSH